MIKISTLYYGDGVAASLQHIALRIHVNKMVRAVITLMNIQDCVSSSLHLFVYISIHYPILNYVFAKRKHVMYQ